MYWITLVYADFCGIHKEQCSVLRVTKGTWQVELWTGQSDLKRFQTQRGNNERNRRHLIQGKKMVLVEKEWPYSNSRRVEDLPSRTWSNGYKEPGLFSATMSLQLLTFVQSERIGDWYSRRDIKSWKGSAGSWVGGEENRLDYMLVTLGLLLLGLIRSPQFPALFWALGNWNPNLITWGELLFDFRLGCKVGNTGKNSEGERREHIMFWSHICLLSPIYVRV